MQQERIYKRERQTVFDILIQYGGAISGLFEFLNENQLTSIELDEGEYIKPKVINADIVARFIPMGKFIETTPSVSPDSILLFTTGDAVQNTSNTNFIISQ